MQDVPAPSSAPASLRRAWLILAVGASAYLVAMLHRMALGVAGTDAAERFGVAVGALGVFTSLQLVLYLAMQVPAGLLADRFGPRRTLAIGLGLMALGELVFAAATSMPAGLVGRGLVGVGDALTFLNVLRLAQAWFPARMQTMLTALIGLAGAAGQLVSTVPLELSLRTLEWSGTFLVLGVLTAVLAVLPLAAVRDRPDVAPAGHASEDETPAAAGAPEHEPIGRTLAAAWRRPATRQGFFTHMGALSPFLVAASVWGVPFMTDAQGLSRAGAASMLLVASIAFAVSGPLIALAVGSDRGRQRRASVIICGGSTAAWAVLLLWPGAVPRGVLAAMLLLTGVCAGGAMLAFEIARRAAPTRATASAGALVNCGGFSAAVIGSLVIGQLLGDGGRGVSATQHAMLPVLAFAAIGFVGVLATRDPGSRTAPRPVAPRLADTGRRAGA